MKKSRAKIISIILAISMMLSFCSFVSAASVSSSPLLGRKALFVGDSISYGALDSVGGRAWAGRIGTTYYMKNDNKSVNGASLSTTRATNRILTQLNSSKNNKYDYVILHGGVNDAWDSVAVGTISGSFDVSSFDIKTFAGGLEELFYYATNYFPNAKIGYIMNFRITKKDAGRIADMSEYFNLAKKICDKWKVPYIDFYNNNDFNNNVLKTNTTTNLPDLVHPNNAGYDLMYPFIASWMETLTNYVGPKSADKRDLSTAIDKAKVLVESKYTADSWSNIQKEIQAAQSVLGKYDATQKEVDNALTALNATLDNLATNTDNSRLSAAVADVEMLAAQDYTAESWEPFAAALESAKKIVANSEADQKSINSALDALQSAKDNLQPQASTAVANANSGNEYLPYILIAIIFVAIAFLIGFGVKALISRKKAHKDNV